VWEDGDRDIRPTALRLDRSTDDEGTARLRVAGEVDMATVGPLVAHMDSILRDPFVRHLVVDLGGVGFLDSSGIEALVSALRLGQTRHVGVQVVNCRPNVQRVLEITGVDKVLAGHWQ
jgi:anti-anti-sigma factor